MDELANIKQKLKEQREQYQKDQEVINKQSDQANKFKTIV